MADTSWNASTGDEVMTLRGHTHCVHSAIYSHDGKRIISGSNDYTVKVWDVTTGTQLMTLPGHTSWISSVAISTDDKTIATGDSRGNVILWESSLPANSHGARLNSRVAQEVVDKLYERHGLYTEVIDKLKGDSALDEAVRTLALRIAHARRWQDAEKHKKDSWEVVSSPDWDVRAYQAALEKAQEAKRLEPNDPSILAPLYLPRYFGAGANDGRPSPSILTVLGIAEYRTGSYEEALETLTHVEKIRKDNQLESDPACMAFIVMALNKLERPEEAEASLYNLRQLCKDEQLTEDEKAQAFLAEAERVLSGEN